MCRQPARTAALAVAGLLVTLSTANAQSTTSGTSCQHGEFGFHYPAGRNGTLVIWLPDVATSGIDVCLGSFFGDPGYERAGPLAAELVAQGYSVAVTTYQGSGGSPRPGGYGTFTAVDNLRRLIAKFTEDAGAPSQVLLYGEGVGGLIAVEAIEKGIDANVTGALAMCAPLAGSRKWDAMLDLRLAYDAVCSDAGSQAQLPGGATGLPENDDVFRLSSFGSTFGGLATTIRRAVNACTGVDQAPKLRSREQVEALGKLVELTTRSEQSLQRNMWWATAVLGNMTFDPNQLDGKVGVGNQRVAYPDPGIDAAIERVKPNRRAAKRLAKFYTPTGKLGAARVLALHTDQDGESLVEHLSDFASKAPASSFTSAVAVETTPTHCGFTPAERLAAWESLLAWIRTGNQPTVASVQSACETHAGARTAAGPCRIDPEFVVGSLDSRILAR